jgi:hypothetical protein
MATAVSSDGKAINNMQEHSDMFHQKLVAIEEQTDAAHADMEEAKLTARNRRPWLIDHWIADWRHCGRY